MKLQIFNSILQMTETQWTPLVPANFPFADHRFFSALERNRCLGPRTGWEPFYLTLWQEDRLVACLSVFLKNNSYGEYIFDFNWAAAYRSLGLEYYPKLVSAIPFTPATGPKLLLAPFLTPNEKEVASQELLAAAKSLGEKLGTASLHALFILENEIDEFRSAGFMIRHSYQFHWENQGFQTFDGFLESLRSKRRKEIRRERQQVAEQAIKIHRLKGDQLTPLRAEQMYNFYRDTTQKMGGHDYLTREFFQDIFANMNDRVLFVVAENEDAAAVAGALFYYGTSVLFGRHWGCAEDFKSLHFELCYYQGIEFAIEHKMHLFEAGAQGEHKLQRGFLPRLTLSAHQLSAPPLQKAIHEFVEHEKMQIAALFDEYAAHTPFSRAEAGAPLSP